MTDMVTDTSLAGTLKPQHERSPSTPPAHSPVRFSTRCAGGPAYLLLGNDDGHARALHQMEEGEGGLWQVVVRLAAGTYRYRYYAEPGVAATDARPGEADDAPVRMGGSDAALTVSSRKTIGGEPLVEVR